MESRTTTSGAAGRLVPPLGNSGTVSHSDLLGEPLFRLKQEAEVRTVVYFRYLEVDSKDDGGALPGAFGACKLKHIIH